MKSRIIYVRASNYRAAKYRTMTYAVQDENGLRKFRKMAITPDAKPHIHEIVKTYELMKKNKVDQYFCPVTLNGDCIEMPEVKGTDLESKLLSAVLENDEERVEEIIKSYREFLDKLSNTGMKALPTKSIIIENLPYKSFSDSKIYPGVIDLNLDNIIDYDGTLMAIDYEWDNGTPVPVDYVFMRAIYWFCVRYNDLFKLNAERIKFFEYSNTLAIPALLMASPKEMLAKIRIVEKVEVELQKHVTGSVSVPKEKSTTLRPLAREPRYALEVLREEMKNLKNDIAIKTTELESSQELLIQAQTQLTKIKSNPAYKIAMSVKKTIRKIQP